MTEFLTDAAVEMYYSSQWNDITDDVELPISVTYGGVDELGTAPPTDVQLTLDNSSNTYSPKDPRSSLYGLIDRGTPLRVRVGNADPRLYLPGVVLSAAETTASTGLGVTGDLDIRMEIEPDTWRPDSPVTLAGRWVTTGDDRSWVLRLMSTGRLYLGWTTSGAFATADFFSPATAIPEGSGRLAIRFTLDVNNGSGGNTGTAYTSDSIDGAWAQLGAAVTDSGITSIHSGMSVLEIGTANNGGAAFTGDEPFRGAVFAFELLDGIGGTAVANPDFTAQDTDTTSFTDAAGRSWALREQAAITDPSLRANVEVASWVPRWDPTANAAKTVVQASGILRRLGQGQASLRSALFYDLSERDNIVAYWPCEGGAESTRFSSPLDDTAMQWPADVVEPGKFTSLLASDALPTTGDGVASVVAPDYDGATDQRLFGVFSIPDSGAGSTDATLLGAWMQSEGRQFRATVVIQSDGDLYFRAGDGFGSTIVNSGAFASDRNGRTFMLSLLLTQDGSDIDYQVAYFDIGEPIGFGFSGTITGYSYTQFRWLEAGNNQTGGNDVAFGHVAILNDDVDSIWDVIFDSLAAWRGETAGDRMVRLSSQDGVALQLIGDPDETERVGAQTIASLLDLVEECAEADMGLLGERRDSSSLLYRARHTLYDQTPIMTLDMDDGHIANPFEPPLDDQGLRNDVTVKRDRGGSGRAVLTGGSVGVDAFVGRHDASVTVNLYTDAQTEHHASWRLHLGSVDGHRVASLTIELEHHSDLHDAIRDMQRGDLIRLTNIPEGMPPDDLDLIVLGWSESIDRSTWHITLNCAPGEPWSLGHIADSSAANDGPTDRVRADTLGSTLWGDISSSATLMSVTTTSGPVWTTDADDLPFDITMGGETLRVTAISGAISPQTFTVTRSINGVEKAHSAGADIRLRYPMIVGL